MTTSLAIAKGSYSKKLAAEKSRLKRGQRLSQIRKKEPPYHKIKRKGLRPPRKFKSSRMLRKGGSRRGKS